ncbi:hypothetical protein [Bacillus cereus group sp. TH160LC]|uniref:hypothetical protein n=1 Tax=Bacillus cereus group sp. TH160LC TaxID=3018058 RepID=UPI0022E5EFF8|nr:hypothetical protein [Bacillus cereus group sp. TH160LC]MDA1652631.1 hypothetical protein [Bacillus cereus group sp. TH160LC]
MYTDSIEYLAEQIYHYKTKEYFKEVLVSYSNGNNRSAVVMLYSVVICDLIYKLQELEDKYNDTNASDILNNVKNEQEQNPTSSLWESNLIKEVYERTNLLEGYDYENILFLRKHRHLSAHPVLDQLDILFKPNKENVRSHMRNMLDGVLCKSPLLSNKLTDTFLKDLESIKNILVKNSDLERYLDNKYLSKINNPLSQKLFKDLWKFVFRLENEESNANRRINYRALKTMFERNSHQYLEVIQNETSYFSRISHDNDDILFCLQALFSLYPELYNLMEEPFKIILQQKSTNDLKIFARSIYLNDNVNNHFLQLNERIKQEEYTHLPIEDVETEFLYSFSNKRRYIKEFLDFMIILFEESRNYDSGDLRFSRYIKVYLDEFTLDQYKSILNAINSNSQLADRRDAIGQDNASIKAAIEKKYPEQINYSDYRNFKVSR